MHSLFSELRKLKDDILTVVRSPAKMKSLLHIPLYFNAFLLMLANLTNALFGFVFWIIAARLYSTKTVGVGSAIISAAALLEMLCGLGIGYGIIRFLKSSNDAVRLINSSFTLTGLLSLVAAAIFILGLGIWSPALNIIHENPYYLVVFLLYVPILVLDNLTDQVMVAGRQAKFILIHYLIFNTLRIALLVLLAAFLQSLGIFGSWSAATFIALLASVFLLLPRTHAGYRLFFIVEKRSILEILHFSFLNYLGDLFWNLPGLVLPLIVVNLLGAENNAYFFIAWAVNSVLIMIPAAVATSLLAEGAYDNANLKNHISRSLKMLAVLMVPTVILVWFLANKFLLLYGGLYAENATTLLRWLAIASVPLAINIVYFSIKRVQKNVKPVILLAAFMAVIVVLASYLLLPRVGITGIGIAWLAGQSATALIAIVSDMRRWI